MKNVFTISKAFLTFSLATSSGSPWSSGTREESILVEIEGIQSIF